MSKIDKWNIKETVDYLNSVIEKGEIPGASLGVINKDGAKHVCMGYAQTYPCKVPLKEEQLYDLASLTKVVSTTTLALKCIEKGLFTLKTRLQEILPDFPHSDVTIEHILTHTSGICADDKKYKKCSSKKEIREFFFSKELSFVPGSKVEYSDFGYVALGFAIEELLGPLNEVAKEWIFAPLGMSHTLYRPTEQFDKEVCVPTELTENRGLIQGVVHDGKANILEGVSGNAGLFSTVTDLSKFVSMILNNGSTVLSKTSINLLKKCYTEKLNLRRTLGWFSNEPSASIGDYYSDIILFHTGFTGTSILIDLERECGIILLTNRIHPSRNNDNIAHIRNTVHNLLLKAYDETEE